MFADYLIYDDLKTKCTQEIEKSLNPNLALDIIKKFENFSKDEPLIKMASSVFVENKNSLASIEYNLYDILIDWDAKINNQRLNNVIKGEPGKLLIDEILNLFMYFKPI